jgi:hypothetical protein
MTTALCAAHQPTSAYVSIRQHTSGRCAAYQYHLGRHLEFLHSAYVSIRQHTSAHVIIRQHTSAYVSIRLHSSPVSSRPSSKVFSLADILAETLSTKEPVHGASVSVSTYLRTGQTHALKEAVGSTCPTRLCTAPQCQFLFKDSLLKRQCGSTRHNVIFFFLYVSDVPVHGASELPVTAPNF